MYYRIGLDIGIASVGFSLYETNDIGEPIKMITAGSRVFDAAEVPKTGASLAKPRRESRSVRRRLRRKKHRKDRIKELLISNNFCNRDDIISSDNTLPKFFSEKNIEDIYEIRVNALTKLLSDKQFTRLLIHLAQKRGFKSNRKSVAETDKDAKKMLGSVNENKLLLKTSNNESGIYKSVGDILLNDDRFKDNKRNVDDNYISTFARDDILDELKMILHSQKDLGNKKVTDEFINKYIEIFEGQRNYDEGPGGNSPYGGDLIEKMVGKCTFFKDKQRAVKSSYTFMYSNLLQKVNNIKTYSVENGFQPLTQDDKQKIIKKAKESNEINFATIRKLLNISDDVIFNSVQYDNIKKKSKKKDTSVDKNEYSNIECEKATKINSLKDYHTMRKAFNKIEKNYIDTMSREKLDEIGKILTFYKTDKTINEYFDEKCVIQFTEEEKNIIRSMENFSKVGNLSLEALKLLEPYLESGLTYDKAYVQAFEGKKFNSHNEDTIKKNKLPKLPEDLYEITSPVVKRSINQTINVVNKIIDIYGSPIGVNIELAREMSKNCNDRKGIENNQKENRVVNEKIKERIKEEFGKNNPTGQDIVKLKLWEEQNGICMYTGEVIKIDELFGTVCDIDHIIPYSISFDDRYINKVLVKSASNREKSNKLPLQFLTGKDKDDFIVRVENSVKNYKKRCILLKKEITEDDTNKFKQRNLQDTQHATRFIAQYIREHLMFNEIGNENLNKKRVITVNGQVTAYLRKRWGLSKIRSNGDEHHALDASVVCVVTDGMIKKVTMFNKYSENKYSKFSNEANEYLVDKDTGEVLDEKHFPMPYDDYREELEARLSDNPKVSLSNLKDRNYLQNYSNKEISEIKPIFISRRVRKKNTGPAHKETLRRLVKNKNEECFKVSKVELSKLELKNGEIKNYYNKESDILLYNAIKKHFNDNGITEKGSGKDLFDEPFYKPKKDGSRGPRVKSVKIIETMSKYVPLGNNGTIADNGSMIRLDIFYVNGKGGGYYAVPIYINDVLSDKLPSKAVVAGKNPWVTMYDEDFLFSLYPNSLIKIKDKKDMEFTHKFNKNADKMKMNDCFVYYKSFNINRGSMKIINHNNSYEIEGKGIKSVVYIGKYNVDVLGHVSKASKEERVYYNNKQISNKLVREGSHNGL